MINRIISIVLILVLIVIAIIGCKRSADSSYNEVIKDGKVEIDGISYDIKSVTQTAYKYDDNGNILEKVTTSNGSKTRIEYIYENGRLIEDRLYSNDGIYSYSDVSLTKHYYYEYDRLVKIRSVTRAGLKPLQNILMVIIPRHKYITPDGSISLYKPHTWMMMAR